jgi:hypothetical protein
MTAIQVIPVIPQCPVCGRGPVAGVDSERWPCQATFFPQNLEAHFNLFRRLGCLAVRVMNVKNEIFKALKKASQ